MNNQTSQQQNMIQAVIFDLDGVLMDSEWLAFLAWREMVSTRGARLDDSVFEGILGLDDVATAEYVMACAGITFDVDKYVDWIKQYMLELIAKGIEPLPGAPELVRELKRRALPLAIASNSYTGYVDNALKGLKLSPFFSVRVGADKVESPKPSPDVYLSAAQRLGVEPSLCLAVEDSRVGMQAASAAGMRVIAVPDHRARQSQFPEAWQVFRTLIDVEKDLDRVLT